MLVTNWWIQWSKNWTNSRGNIKPGFTRLTESWLQMNDCSMSAGCANKFTVSSFYIWKQVTIDIFSFLFLYQRFNAQHRITFYKLLQFASHSAPKRQLVFQTAEGKNKSHLISLNPTQHSVNLLSDCQSISTAASFEVKSTSIFFERKQNCIISWH